MQILEGEIKRLEAEYNMFFAGRLPRLPWETRTKVEALVKRYDRSPKGNTAERFRFQTLQSKFAMFCELWERQLKMQEGGRPRPGRSGPPPPSAPPVPESRRERVVQVAMRDPNAQPDRVKELYERLAEAKQAAGEAPVPFDRVAALVKAQMAKLGGGGDVSFRVGMKDGKVQLTVKSASEDTD